MPLGVGTLQISLVSSLLKYLDTLFQELEGQVGLVLRQGLADRLDEDGVVGRDANAVGLQQVALDLQVEGGGERAEEVVGRRSEVGVGRSQVQECHVQQGSLNQAKIGVVL